MTSYRIETFCRHTGAYQATEVVHSKEALVTHCTTAWRRESVHVAYALAPHVFTPSLGGNFVGVFVDGRCVSPLFNDLH
jgi:hypothetical protein